MQLPQAEEKREHQKISFNTFLELADSLINLKAGAAGITEEQKKQAYDVLMYQARTFMEVYKHSKVGEKVRAFFEFLERAYFSPFAGADEMNEEAQPEEVIRMIKD